MFNTVYRFVLWGRLLLLSSDWTRAGSEEVLATDASDRGYGVCEKRWSQGSAIAAGMVLERSRFKRAPGVGARERARGGLNPFLDFVTIGSCVADILGAGPLGGRR